jgi:hypothetical protein
MDPELMAYFSTDQLIEFSNLNDELKTLDKDKDFLEIVVYSEFM